MPREVGCMGRGPPGRRPPGAPVRTPWRATSGWPGRMGPRYMGWPGVGAPCGRNGTPGRGATGAPGPAGRGCESLATRSGRGGTTGRAAGWPARPGRMVALRAGGVPGAGIAGACPMGADRAVAGGAPVTTRTGSGRTPAGNGWRGPDRICPGRGGAGAVRGTSRIGAPGMTVLAGALATGAAGAAGELASGGRNRCGCGVMRGANLSPAGASCPAGSAPRTASTASAGCGFSGAGAAEMGSSATAVAAPFEPGCSAAAVAPPRPKIWRSFSATSSSTELECVFFSVTPSSGSFSSSS